MKLHELFEEVSQQQLNDVEKFADKLWGKLGIDVKFTKHFIERMNDERNGKPISSAELVRMFKKEYEQYGKEVRQINTNDEAVFIDLITDVNLPFVIKDVKDGKQLVAKTVMRKQNFKSADVMYKVQ